LACPTERRKQRANARQHLLEMEGFRHVVVGAGIEALHLVAPAVARREHEHRMARPARRQDSSTEMPSILGNPMSRITAS